MKLLVTYSIDGWPKHSCSWFLLLSLPQEEFLMLCWLRWVVWCTVSRSFVLWLRCASVKNVIGDGNLLNQGKRSTDCEKRLVLRTFPSEIRHSCFWGVIILQKGIKGINTRAPLKMKPPRISFALPRLFDRQVYDYLLVFMIDPLQSKHYSIILYYHW